MMMLLKHPCTVKTSVGRVMGKSPSFTNKKENGSLLSAPRKLGTAQCPLLLSLAAARKARVPS